MSEAMDPASLKAQAQRHLECLGAAGVEWLPQGPPLPRATPAPVEAPVVQADKTPPAAPSQIGPSQALPVAVAEPPRRTPPTPAPPPPAQSPPAQMTLEGLPAIATLPAMTKEERRQALAVLADKVKGCTRCPELAATRTQTVFADGQPGADLCFIGEAPGADEDAQGLPFVGAAGKLLNKIIEAMGLKREEVYICNIIKCRPPGNRTPLPNEAAHCREFLDRQLELVAPKFICALGGCAATNLLNTTKPLGSLRGKFHDYRGIPVLVTYHPAYLLPHRQPDKKRDVWEDMKMLLQRMGRAVPSPKS